MTAQGKGDAAMRTAQVAHLEGPLFRRAAESMEKHESRFAVTTVVVRQHDAFGGGAVRGIGGCDHRCLREKFKAVGTLILRRA